MIQVACLHLCMNEDFEIPVAWKGEILHFPAKFLQYRYSYKIEVTINGHRFLFEPDEERNWRVLMDHDELKTMPNMPAGLLEATASVMDDLFK